MKADFFVFRFFLHTQVKPTLIYIYIYICFLQTSKHRRLNAQVHGKSDMKFPSSSSSSSTSRSGQAILAEYAASDVHDIFDIKLIAL